MPEKGADLLLRACAALPCAEWTLLILGEGPEPRGWQTLAAQELPAIRSHVDFLGHLPSTAMPGFYRQLDVLVLPSRSCRQLDRAVRPCADRGDGVRRARGGLTCGEIPGVIGDAGIVFPEGDVNALSQALAALAGDRRGAPNWRRGAGRACCSATRRPRSRRKRAGFTASSRRRARGCVVTGFAPFGRDHAIIHE